MPMNATTATKISAARTSPYQHGVRTPHADQVNRPDETGAMNVYSIVPSQRLPTRPSP